MSRPKTLADHYRECMESVMRATTVAMEQERALREQLTRERDVALRERNRCIAAMARMAHEGGFHVGLLRRTPGTDGPWRNLVVIDLPTGQVSFQIRDEDLALYAWAHPYTERFDGHNTESRDQRLGRFAMVGRVLPEK